MSDDQHHGDPSAIVTRRDFGQALNLLREHAGLTIRELGRAVDLPHSTIGGYFSGAHLPAHALTGVFPAILAACGVTDTGQVERWQQALRRARRASGEQAAPTTTAYPAPDADTTDATELPVVEAVAVDRTTLVSIRPPIDRLAREPALRGRADMMERLMAAVSALAEERHDAPSVFVLHGLGGSGKSTIALTAAAHARRLGVRTWWVTAVGPDTVATGMQALAVELGAGPDQIRLGSSPDLVWRLLDQLPEPWMLIVDNADDVAGTLALPGGDITDGTGWIRPAGRRGLTVVTTRDGGARTWGGHAAPWLCHLPVDVLDPDTGARVLLEVAPDAGSELDARRLAHRLGGLPLALSQAGHYLAQARAVPRALSVPGTAHTFADYADQLDREAGTELLMATIDGGRGARETVGHTWLLSLELLRRRGLPLARPLMKLLCCFGPEPVPFELVMRVPTLAASPLFAGVTPQGLWDLLRSLDDLHLIGLRLDDHEVGSVGEQVIVHPLVREVLRHGMDSGTAADYVELCASLIEQATAELDPKDPATWSRWRGLAEHALSPLELAEYAGVRTSAVPPAAVRAAIRSSGYFKASGQLGRAEAACVRGLRTGQAMLDRADPALLELEHLLCRVWYDLGRFHDAVQGLRTVLRERSTTLGPTHPDTLTTQHYLARTLRDSGELDAAWRMFRKTLDTRAAVLGERHRDTLTSRNNVGDALRALGRWERAAEVLASVYADRVELLGPEHPATLVTALHLARLRADRGDPQGAVVDLAELDGVCRRVLGEWHPRTLTVEQTLADILHDLGRVGEAEALSRRVRERRGMVLGDEHPATLVVRHRLALIAADQGRTGEAVVELTSVLRARRQRLGDRHPDTLHTGEVLTALRSRRG